MENFHHKQKQKQSSTLVNPNISYSSASSNINQLHEYHNSQFFWQKLQHMESGINTKEQNTYANFTYNQQIIKQEILPNQQLQSQQLNGSLKSESNNNTNSHVNHHFVGINIHTQPKNKINLISLNKENKIKYPSIVNQPKKMAQQNKAQDSFIIPPDPIQPIYQQPLPSPKIKCQKLSIIASNLNTQLLNFSSQHESSIHLSYQSMIHNLYGNNIIQSMQYDSTHGYIGCQKSQVQQIQQNPISIRSQIQTQRKVSDQVDLQQIRQNRDNFNFEDQNSSLAISKANDQNKGFQEKFFEKEVIIELEGVGLSESTSKELTQQDVNDIFLKDEQEQIDLNIKQSQINKLQIELINLLIYQQNKFNTINISDENQNKQELQEFTNQQNEIIIKHYLYWKQELKLEDDNHFVEWYETVIKQVHAFLSNFMKPQSDDQQITQLKSAEQQVLSQGQEINDKSKSDFKQDTSQYRIIGNQIYGPPLTREQRLVKIRKYLLKKNFKGFYQRQFDYDCRKQHADQRPRDIHGRFLGKKQINKDNERHTIKDEKVIKRQQKTKYKQEQKLFKVKKYEKNHVARQLISLSISFQQ